MNIPKIVIPTKTLKMADKAIEKGIEAGIVAAFDLEFTFDCGHCNKIHHSEIPSVIMAAILRANLTNLINNLEESLNPIELESLELYAGIVSNLYKGNLSNAQLLQEEVVSMISKQMEQDEIQYANVITLELKEWASNG